MFRFLLLTAGLVCLLGLDLTGGLGWCHAREITSVNINCFVYHRFDDDRYPATNITTDDFQRHLQYLKDQNFHVVTLSRALEMLNEGKTPGEKIAVLTVDDGYASFYEKAMPLLQLYGFGATLFVNTATIGNSDFINWEQLRELQRQGIEIGNHSHSHAHFVDHDPTERIAMFRDEVKISQRIFREHLGEAPRLFSYPYGEYSLSMLRVLKEEGFVGAAAQNSGVISKFSDLFALPRFPVAGKYADPEGFKEKASMKALPVYVVGEPDHIVAGGEPSSLKLHLAEPGMVSLNHFQCFVADTEACKLDYDEDNSILTMTAENPLQERRTLYTITAPSASSTGVWHWFSHLWIDPEK